MRALKIQLISLRSTCKVWNLGKDQKQTIIPNIKRKVPCEQTILCNRSKDIWKRVPLGRKNFSNLLTIAEPQTYIRDGNTWMTSKKKSVKQSTTKVSPKSKPLECSLEGTISLCISRSRIRFSYRVIFNASKTWVTGIWAEITIYSKWPKTCC